MATPKPVPAALRKLRGNPSKRAINHQEPSVPPARFERVPPELKGNATAIAEWHRMTTIGRQWITEADRPVVIAACLQWALHLEALDKAGTRAEDVLPNLGIARSALQACMKLWTMLGLTPTSRASVKAADGPRPGGDSFSEFDATTTDGASQH
jgi:phage terminase small subunit